MRRRSPAIRRADVGQVFERGGARAVSGFHRSAPRITTRRCAGRCRRRRPRSRTPCGAGRRRSARNRGSRATSSTSRPRRFRRLTVTSSPDEPERRATTIWPERASAVRCTARRSPSRMPASRIDRPAHAQQVIGARREEVGIDAVVRLDVSTRRAAARRRRRVPPAAAAPARARPADPCSRRPRDAPGLDLEHAFLLQRAQVVLGRARRGKAQARGDFRARRRPAGGLQMAADPVEDLLLPRGERRAAYPERPGPGSGRAGGNGEAFGYRMNMRYTKYSRSTGRGQARARRRKGERPA